MDVQRILVGHNSTKAQVKAQALAAYELDLARQTHAANEKHNARLTAQGIPGRFVCGPRCDLCHPPAEIVTAPTGLSTRDLRGVRTGPKVVLRGKRGRCHGILPDGTACKVKLTRRGWFCRECKDRRAKRGRR